jgi:ribosomal protein L31
LGWLQVEGNNEIELFRSTLANEYSLHSIKHVAEMVYLDTHVTEMDVSRHCHMFYGTEGIAVSR